MESHNARRHPIALQHFKSRSKLHSMFNWAKLILKLNSFHSRSLASSFRSGRKSIFHTNCRTSLTEATFTIASTVNWSDLKGEFLWRKPSRIGRRRSTTSWSRKFSYMPVTTLQSLMSCWLSTCGHNSFPTMGSPQFWSWVNTKSPVNMALK